MPYRFKAILSSFLILAPACLCHAVTPSVGATGGSFTLSQLGAAIYRMPIEVPAGRNGMQPSIAISYNSQSGNGIAGFGTSLEGFSSITVGQRDIYHDGYAQGIGQSGNDALYLDGSRLLLKSGTGGHDGDVYVVESAPFTTVTEHGTIGNGNVWFEVLAQDGMLYRYGMTENSRLSYTGRDDIAKTYSWNICHTEDPSGNYMDYSYQEYGHTKYPLQVSYGGNTNVNTGLTNTVTFTYATRNDIRQFCFDSTTGMMDRILTSITSGTGNSVYRSYTLSYDTTGDGTAFRYSRLTSITESNGQGQSLPPVTFSWAYLPQTNYVSHYVNMDLQQSSLQIPFSDQEYHACDINGDGLDDIVGYYDTDNEYGHVILMKYLSVPSDGSAPSYIYAGSDTFTPGYTRITSGSYSEGFIGYMNSKDYGGSMAIDFDGNGCNEFALPCRYRTTSFDFDRQFDEYLGFFLCNQDGHTFIETQLTMACTPLWTSADIDNDGMTEILVLETVPRDNMSHYRLHILSYPWMYADDACYDLSMPGTPRDLIMSDMNGNGLQDMLILYDQRYDLLWNQGGSDFSAMYVSDYGTNWQQYRSWGWEPGHNNIVRTGDFNGDGLPDILTNDAGTDSWMFNFNNGNGSFTELPACTLNITEQAITNKDDDKFSCSIVDFDGDGKSDVIITKAMYNGDVFDGTYTYWLRSTGNALELIHYAPSTHDYDAFEKRYVTGDFDGDGRIELVNYGYDCANGSSTATAWRQYDIDALTASSGHIISVTGDYGNVTDITYSMLTDAAVYSRNGSYAYPAPAVTAPLSVVSRTRSDNGAAGSVIAEYRYSDLRVHLAGRGLLGYAETTVDNVTANTIVTNGIDGWHPMLYAPTSTYTTCTAGGYTSGNSTTLSYVIKSDGSYCAYKSVTEAVSQDGKTIAVQIADTIHGYALCDTVYYGTRGSGMYIANINGNHTYAGRRYQPQTVTQVRKHPDDGQPYILSTHYTYNLSSGLATTSTVYYGSERQLTTDFTYDMCGNLLSNGSHAAGQTAPVTQMYEYDSSLRFVTRQYTSPASFDHTASFDIWGNELSTTELGITVTNGYDGWNRLVSTGTPGHGNITYTYGWDSTGESCYYVLRQEEGQPWTKTWYDGMGREVRSESIGPKNVQINMQTTYGTNGRPAGITRTTGDMTAQTTFQYDGLDRITDITETGNRLTHYDYDTLSVTETRNGRTLVCSSDPWGGTRYVISDNGTQRDTVSYTYSSNGHPLTATTCGHTTTFGYDAAGDRIMIVDPDAGTLTYSYDAFGRETSHIDARNIVFHNNYDYLGRLVQTIAGTDTTTYVYGTSGNGAYRLVSESLGNVSIDYEYDRYGRMTKERRDGHDTEYQYSDIGLITKMIWPDNCFVEYSHDTYGNVTQVHAAHDSLIWNLTGYTGKTATSTITLESSATPMVRTTRLDADGRICSQVLMHGTDTLQNSIYTYDSNNGNLLSRSYLAATSATTSHRITESFTYDDIDRLRSASSGNAVNMEMDYARNGNITYKSGIGVYSYDGQAPHAVTEVDNTDGLISDQFQFITYNAASKVSYAQTALDSYVYNYDIVFGPDGQRMHSTMKRYDAIEHMRYYGTDYEETRETRYLYRHHYIYAPDGLAGIYVTRMTTYPRVSLTTVDNIYCAETDNLGSITGLYDKDGVKCFGATYDVWGLRSTPNWSIKLDRGFTGHEHIDELGLIDMNGRMYDPLIARFLSPDPYVQMTNNSQNYNRYSYCLNNPLKYTDPSGESIAALVAMGLMTVGMINVIIQAGNENINSFGDALSAMIGGASAAISEASSWVMGLSALATGSPLGVLYGSNLILGKNISSTTTIASSISNPANAAKIFLGRYYTDPDLNAGGQALQGLSRFTWEGTQTWAGYNWSQLRNTFGDVDKVGYLGGATFVVNENAHNTNGISLGSYININFTEQINDSFEEFVKKDAMFMHEYGHSFDSRKFGPAYLFAIGIPSLISASKNTKIKVNDINTSTHNMFWTEQRASIDAYKYFNKYYGVNIDVFKSFLPQLIL